MEIFAGAPDIRRLKRQFTVSSKNSLRFRKATERFSLILLLKIFFLIISFQFPPA